MSPALVETIAMEQSSLAEKFHAVIDTQEVIRHALGDVTTIYYDGPLIENRLQPWTRRDGKNFYVHRRTQDRYSGYFIPDRNARKRGQTMLFLGVHEENDTLLFELRRVPTTSQPEPTSTHRQRRLFSFPASEKEYEKLQEDGLAETMRNYLTNIIHGRRRRKETSDYFSVTDTVNAVPSY